MTVPGGLRALNHPDFRRFYTGHLVSLTGTWVQGVACTLVFGGTFPIGAFLVGSIAEAWGVGVAFLCAGGVGLVALGVIIVSWEVRAR